MATPKKIVYAFLLLGACSGPFGGSPTDPGDNDLQADLTAYDRVQQALDGHRTQTLSDSAQEIAAVHDHLYYKTYPGFSAKLHRRDDATGKTVDYGFSIGEGDLGNYRASDAVVLSAERQGDTVRYRAFDATQTNAPLSVTEFPSPSGAKWWAYAIDGTTAYVVADANQKPALYRFDVHTSATPTLLGTLESTTGTEIGEFYDFDVAGQRMVFIESGRVWQLDLGTMHSTSLENQIQVSSGAAFDSRGVTFSTEDDRLMFFDATTRKLRNLSDEIAKSDYALNATYDKAHYYYQDYTRWGAWVVYGASVDGIFAYNLDTKAVAPVLLPPRDAPVRVVYRYPVALDDGSLYVVGLLSESGSVGAEGPVFHTDLAALLR